MRDKELLDKQKLEEIINTKPTLKEMLKGQSFLSEKQVRTYRKVEIPLGKINI